MNLAQIHATRVACFASLYKNVTAAMEVFRDDPESNLLDNERQWITFLIKGFEERYHNWLSAEATYLHTLYKYSNRLLMLLGHAYLHIGFDLSVVIAESLHAYDAAGKPLINASRGSDIFDRLEKALETAVRADWERPLPVDAVIFCKTDNQLLGWVVGLRNTAWKHGLAIAEVIPDKRASLIDKLHRNVHRIVKKELSNILTMFMVSLIGFRPPNLQGTIFGPSYDYLSGAMRDAKILERVLRRLSPPSFQ